MKTSSLLGTAERPGILRERLQNEFSRATPNKQDKATDKPQHSDQWELPVVENSRLAWLHCETLMCNV